MKQPQMHADIRMERQPLAFFATFVFNIPWQSAIPTSP